MRIISGKFRGKKLLSPEGKDVRPTADKVKGAVFNMLRPMLEDAVFVDLFSGSGAIGIEAISNGAAKVIFCDSDRESVALLRKNLVGIGGSTEIFECDFVRAVHALAKKGFRADIIYADPPYRGGFESKVTGVCVKILSDNGLLFVEHGRDTPVPQNGLLLVNEKKYGITEISVFRKPRYAAVTGTFDPFTEGHRFLVEIALKEFDKVFVVHLVNPDKIMKYSLEKRLTMTAESLAEFGDRIVTESFDGLAVDYCSARGITAIVRGYRNAEDLQYEEAMAEYNRKLSGIPTLLYEAVQKEISSTEVRARVDNGVPVEGFVAEAIKKEL